MSKHTHRPGPYRVGRGAGGEPFSIESATRTLALVKTDGEHTEGNANLFAAAPDLLAACKSLEELDTRNLIQYANVPTGKLNYMNAIALIRSAIARAEGGAA